MNRKRILFIAQHRPNRSPSQRFRFEQYLSFLNENGYETHFSYLIDARDDGVLYTKNNNRKKARILAKSFRRRQQDVKSLSQFDMVFVQREAFMTGTTYFERKFAKSKAKFIFDFDDSIWLPNVSDANKHLKFLKNPEKTARIIRLADGVIAGNEYLSSFAKQFNDEVFIIPTTIDTESYQPIPRASKSDKVVIGWSGSITTIQHFNYAVPVLMRLKEKYKDRLAIRVIGDGNYINDALQIKGEDWKAATEIEDLSAIDIGIMPLPDDEWAKGKCGLKGLQYMALEIPTLMSPIGVNTDIIIDGFNGFLPIDNDDWFAKISSLIEDAALRLQIGKAGRKTVEERYSVKANAPKYLSVFDAVLQK